MTLAELIDMTKMLLGGQVPYTDGAIAQFLNMAQEHVSRELRAPTQTVFYRDVSSIGNFNWPNDARDDGILYVYALSLNDSGSVTSSTNIPVYDFDTASSFEPNWTTEEAADTARFIVWDQAAEVNTPVPVPPPSSANLQSFRITYVVRPAKMDVMTDEPFNGEMESFHDTLAFRVAWLLARDQAMLMEYQKRIKAARGSSVQGFEVVKNPMYSQNVITSGRG